LKEEDIERIKKLREERIKKPQKAPSKDDDYLLIQPSSALRSQKTTVANFR